MHVTHDIHTHTLFSSCCSDPAATIAAYFDKAYALGHTAFGITNHMWDETVGGASGWYKGQPTGYVLEGRHAFDAADKHGIRGLFGAEVEYTAPTDTLALTVENAKKFDYILVPHTHTHMRDFVFPEPRAVADLRKDIAARVAAALPELSASQVKKMTDTLKHADLYPAVCDTFDLVGDLAAFCLDSLEKLLANENFVRIAAAVPTFIAHPCSPCEDTAIALAAVAALDKDRLFDLCRRAARMGVMFDVNMGVFRAPDNDFADDPTVTVMRIAKDAGVRFGCSTDSHTLEGLSAIRRADLVTAAAGIVEDDLWSELR